VRGDRDLLFLALYNLVSNALKYSSAGDTIEVRGSEREGGVMIEVADTGRGIPDHEHTQVWEELARGRTTLDVPGSGLGLPFVRAIVERHSGQVQLSSRPGEGTAVRVALPL
jgi:two-component system OmpR family sensor kinase